MPRLTLPDGARLHYHDIGRGPTVMLLHGFAMAAALWLPFVMPLSRRYRFILPDLRGFGASHRLPLSQTCLLTQHADDVQALMERLDLQDVRLGGLSMGACTALQYHRLHGFDRVCAYLHMDQAPCVRNNGDWVHGLMGEEQEARLLAWGEVMNALEVYRGQPITQVPVMLRRRLGLMWEEFLRFAFHHPAWLMFSRVARYELLSRRFVPTANWSIYLDCMHSYLNSDYDWRPSLSKMRVPMTIMVGMRSRMYPPAGQFAIRELVPHAEFVCFEDCGHAFPFEAPRQFARELTRFLDRSLAASPAQIQCAVPDALT